MSKKNNIFLLNWDTLRQILCMACILSCSLAAFAQKRVTGTVTDAGGEPVIGANVVEKGTTNGVITAPSGKFSMEVNDGAILQISYIGYISREVAVGNQSQLQITLVEDSRLLEEVVVVGYGVVKKSDLTGSVTDIKSSKLLDQPTTSIDQKLVGRVAGMQIQQGSGAPGSAPIITIRGNGSLGAGNEPLYVVDGMPYSKVNDEDVNPLVFINPNDIESISVLRDASSTAIYGSRGSNGVIIITTKNAGKDITEINFSSYVGVSQAPQKGRPKMMNGYEFATFMRERIAMGVRSKLNREPVESDYPVEYQNVESIGEGTNWYDLILRDATMQNYYLDIQQSMGNSRFYLGLGYANQEGVIYNSGLERFSVNFKYNFNLNNKIIIDASMRPTFLAQDRIVSGVSRSDFLSIALWANPVMSPYDDDGNLIPYIYSPASVYASVPWGFPNPLFALQNVKENYGVLRNLGNVSAQFNFLPSLSFKSSFNTIYNHAELNKFTPSTVGGENSPPRASSATANRSRTSGFNWLWENTLNYHKSFGKHSLSGLLGYTAQKSYSRGLSLNVGPFANDLIETINAALGITSWAESISEWSLISYLGRVNYSFNNKYLLTATLRSDGSSRFGENNRFALFPSAAVAWRISDEGFLKAVSTINQLKVRASYGKSGNNNIGNYSHLSTVNSTQYVFDNKTVSAATISLANPYLGWEESEQIDLGVDLGMFDNRLTFNADLYRKKSVNMLLSDYIPTITGFATQLVNKGNVENKGIELELGVVPFLGDFTWDLGFNIAFNRNKVLSTNQNNDPILSGSVDGRASNISEVGQPIGMFYGFILDGVYSPEDIANPEVAKYPGSVAGYPKYRDVDGNGIIQEIMDYTSLGSPHPDFTYGFNTSVRYKNIDLALSLNGRQGGYIVNGLRQTIDNMQGLFNVQKEWVNRWKSPEDPGDGIHAQGPQIVHRLNSLWLEDASYVRITNLTLGYTLPNSIVQKTKVVKNVRVYASAQNLLTVTDYRGANPEGQASNVNSTLSPGIDSNAYPVPRTFTLGINVKF
jgi:TonB-linked SusC/RagA family outer membrane protein